MSTCHIAGESVGDDKWQWDRDGPQRPWAGRGRLHVATDGEGCEINLGTPALYSMGTSPSFIEVAANQNQTDSQRADCPIWRPTDETATPSSARPTCL